MKILKKLLIICCFSLLFIVGVNSATNIEYTTTALSFIQEDKEYIVPLIKNNISQFYLDNVDDYIFSVYKTSSYNYILYIFNNDINITNSSGQFTWSGKACSFSSDSTYSSINVTSCSQQFSSGGTAYIQSFFQTNYFIPEFGRDTEFKIYNANYRDYTFLNYLNSGSNITLYKGDNVLFKDVVYALNDYVPPEENPNKCLIANQIGETRNISSITFRVTGVTNALDYPLEGYFDLQSNTFFDRIDVLDYVSYVDVVVNDIQSDDEYDVEYNLQWIEGTSSDFLRLNYTITAIDDIDTNIDVSFTLKSKDVDFDPFFENLLLIYGCPPNNIYTNISYGYIDDDNGISYSSDSILSNWMQNQNPGNISPLLNTDLIGDGPVDSILLLPLNIMRNLLNVLNTNTCQPLVLPLPFLNSNITLPCINTLYNQINGLSTFLNWFSAIASAFILYEYFIRLFKWVDNLLTFRENNHFGGF